MTISIRPAHSSDALAISKLIRGLAGYAENDVVNPEVESWFDTITPEAIADRIAAPGYLYIVAEDDSGICGAAALRDGRHIYHLFVRQEMHRQGVARQLWERLKSSSQSSFFTVNSSMYAVPVYMRLGFVVNGQPQSRNGVTVQPMIRTAADVSGH